MDGPACPLDVFGYSGPNIDFPDREQAAWQRRHDEAAGLVIDPDAHNPNTRADQGTMGEADEQAPDTPVA